MSVLLDRLNTIRMARDVVWMTMSQRLAKEKLIHLVRSSSTVNLFGSAGSGKTFLAWFLAEQLAYQYLVHPTRLGQEEIEPRCHGIIIDNCPSSRSAHREILKELSLHGITQAILISRKAIEDYGYSVQIQCTEDDLTHVRENLALAHILPLPQDANDLWALVNQF